MFDFDFNSSLRPRENAMYRYTTDNKYLTNDLRDFYEKNGYIVISELVNHVLLDKFRQRFLQFCDGTIVDGAIGTVMKDQVLKSKNATGEHLIVKIQDFLYDDVLFKYASYGPLVDIVQSIIGPNITVCHSMLINKPPDSVEELSEQPIHQDLHYFPFRPADSIVASWTAMEHTDERNGCLFVVPGSHRSKTLYRHEYKKTKLHNAMYHEAQVVPTLPAINLCMEKGDTVFFHPLLLHGSGPNITDGFRKAISCHYADTNCLFIDVRGTVQDNIASEMVQYAKKVFNEDMSFAEVFKLKSRLVRGPPGNFQAHHSKL